MEELKKRPKRARLGEKKREGDAPEDSQVVKKQQSKMVNTPIAVFTSAHGSSHVYDEIMKNFEWGESRSDRKRIIDNSIKFSNTDIRKAFEEVYGMKIKKGKEDHDPAVYFNAQVGDIIPLKIKSIDKKGAHFDVENSKEEFSSAINLYQYKKFQDFIPKRAINCKVISRTENKIVVDPLAPMYDEWLQDKLSTIDSQLDMNHDRSIIVRDLKLTKSQSMKGGGYFGAVRVDNVSSFLGQDVFIKCFIPGSQIVLNIENDFEKWNGKEVRAFITNYVSDRMSLICSAKEYLKFQGDKNKIEIFKDWSEDNKNWSKESKKEYDGIITGVINSAKKCGVFVEIPELSINSMVNVKPNELVNYRKNIKCRVKWYRFDENTFYNADLCQVQHRDPYIVDNGILKKCYLKAIFEFVK